MHVTWDHERPPTKFETNPTTFNFLLPGHPGQGAGEAALGARLPAGPQATACPARGKRSPQKFFISWTICTKFGMHVTWDHGRPPTKFETNPTTFNFRPPLRGCLATSNATCHIFQSAADAARTVRFRSKLQGRSGRSSSLCLPSFKSTSSGMKILHAL